ncbi:MAG: DUF1922 domain-containing protein [Candidatus Odinarchaeia archaeon]
MKYKVIMCPHCKTPFYIKTGQKTKKCPSCNKTLTIEKIKVIYSTDDVEDALTKVIHLKNPKKNSEFTQAYEILRDEG